MSKSISSFNNYEICYTKYKIYIYHIPPGTHDNHPFEGNYDDRMIDIPKCHGSVWADIYNDDGEIIGNANFGSDGMAVRCDGIDIFNLHDRRKGLATQIYKEAARIFQCPVVPSNVQTADARAFWAGKTSITYP